MTTNLTPPNPSTIITNNQLPTTRRCGLNKTGICCKESDTAQHTINGFKNRDLARRLYRHPPQDADEAHRRCERVSRLIVKLRGHGLVAKVPRSRLYRVTHYGNRVLSAAISLHDDSYPDKYLAAT